MIGSPVGSRGCRSARRQGRSPGRRRGHGRSRPAGARHRTARRAGASPRREPNGREGLPCQATSAGHARVQQAVGNVLHRAEPLDEVELLEHEADAPAADRGQAGVAAADVDRRRWDGAARRALQGADDVHQRRLARAGRADDHDELAARPGGHPVERMDRRAPRVLLHHVVELEHDVVVRAGGPSLSSLTPSPPDRRRRYVAGHLHHPVGENPSSTPTRWVAALSSMTSRA